MILEKIYTYMETYSVQKLLDDIWIGSKTYYEFKDENNERKFSKNTLDKIYKFFNEKPDEYYEKRLRKIVKSENIFGAFFQGATREIWFWFARNCKNNKSKRKTIAKYRGKWNESKFAKFS